MVWQGSETAYQIAGIKNLKMVNCYRLIGADDTLNGIMAYYEDKIINLCSTEEYFQELFDRLVKQYAKEAPTSMIVTDDNTRQILFNAGESDTAGLEKRLSSYKETSTPLFLPKAFSHHYILPMVRFMIERLYGEREGGIVFDVAYKDWFGQGVMSAVSNNNVLHFPYRILQKTDDNYEVRICNVLKPGDNMNVMIVFGKDRIMASFIEEAYCYRGDLVINMNDNSTTVYYCIREGSKPVITKENVCGRVENAGPGGRLTALTETDSAEWKVYELPWKDTVYMTRSGKDEYRILSIRRDGMNISRCNVFRNVAGDEGPQILFGRLAFMLYERDDAAELHIMDMAYPKQAEMSAAYAGRIYTAGV